MDKRLSNKLTSHIRDFKDKIKEELLKNNYVNDEKKLCELLNFIYDFKQIEITKDDFLKRKRIKNTIPENNRCNACKAGGEQCTRRRKDNSLFCGTHMKGAPHGEVCQQAVSEDKKIIEITATQINGIIYYIDNIRNVYKMEDVLSNIEDPTVIGDYKKINNEILINIHN